jgi:hypothetical protein
VKPIISIWSLSPHDPKNPTVTIFILPFRWLGFAFAQPKKTQPSNEQADLHSKRARTLSDFTRHTRSGLSKFADVKAEEDPLKQTPERPSRIPSLIQRRPSIVGGAFELDESIKKQSTRRWHRAQRHQASRLNEGLSLPDTSP